MNWTLSHADNIPLQRNNYDCGLFVLKYAQYLAHNEPFDFSQDDMDYFRRRMVIEIVRENEMWP